MHPVLRLWEDFLTDRGVLSLPALPRMLYVVRGAPWPARARSRKAKPGTAGRRDGAGERGGRDALALGSVDRHAGAWRNGAGAISRERLAARLETLPEGDLLWRGDSVAFPPGGCAYLHRHQGPGIRCLIEGGCASTPRASSHTYGSATPGTSAGPEPVFAQAGRPADPLHPRDDPAARADRQKLDPVCQRGRQGEAENAAIPRVRRRAAGAGASGRWQF